MLAFSPASKGGLYLICRCWLLNTLREHWTFPIVRALYTPNGSWQNQCSRFPYQRDRFPCLIGMCTHHNPWDLWPTEQMNTKVTKKWWVMSAWRSFLITRCMIYSAPPLYLHWSPKQCFCAGTSYLPLSSQCDIVVWGTGTTTNNNLHQRSSKIYKKLISSPLQ